jgi:hypothetical protein
MTPPGASEQGDDESDDHDEETFPIGTYAVDQEDPDPNLAIVINRPPVTGEDWVAYHTPETGEVTVAEDNPDYDPEAQVVVVAFFEEFVEAHAEWTPEDGPFPLDQSRVTTYAFPPGRLDEADPGEWDVDTDALGRAAGDEEDADDEDDEPKGQMAAITPGSSGTDDEDDESEEDAEADADADDTEDEAEKEEPEPEPPELEGEMADLRDRLAENATVDVKRGEEDQAVLAVSKLGDEYEVYPDGEITGEGVLRARLDDVVAEYLE